jgi:hypothetical protein
VIWRAAAIVLGCFTRSTPKARASSRSLKSALVDLGGVVGKRKMGVYREDRPDWVKIKNKAYSQAEGRHNLARGKHHQ